MITDVRIKAGGTCGLTGNPKPQRKRNFKIDARQRASAAAAWSGGNRGASNLGRLGRNPAPDESIQFFTIETDQLLAASIAFDQASRNPSPHRGDGNGSVGGRRRQTKESSIQHLFFHDDSS
jgi:hypothetical protein